MSRPPEASTPPPAGAPHATLPYDPEAAPPGPEGVEGWASCDDFLRRLSGYGVPAADDFVRTQRHLHYPDVRRFFGAIAPDPMLGDRDDAREPRQELGLPPDDMPPSLAEALREIVALPPDHASRPLHVLATYVQDALHFSEGSHEPALPPWADPERILRGQRAFQTRLLPAVLVLVCKSLVEAYSAARPASVLNLSGELAELPYHRLLGTLQLLVTVSTPHSFEGPWYPALVAAQEMQLLHAGVRMNVAPRLTEPKRGRIDRGRTGWTGRDDHVLWGGYEAFRKGWPYRDLRDIEGARPADGGSQAVGAGEGGLPGRGAGIGASEGSGAGGSRGGSPEADPPQVAVSQTDMLATIIAFALLVVEGWERLDVPLEASEADDYWHLWRVFAVRKGMHPPGRPDDGSWVPATIDEARAFWRTYRRHYLVGPVKRRGDWVAEAQRANPSGYALTSAHLRMLARLVKVELPWIPIGEKGWLHVFRYYVERLTGEEGAARVGVPAARYSWFIRVALEHLPHAWARLWSRVNVDAHVAISRRFLTALIGQVYGDRVVFPIPQTADDLREFVEHTERTRPVPEGLRRL